MEYGRVAATPFSPAVQVLLNITNRFQRAEKKKEVEIDLFSEFAPLTAQFSNQLFEDFKKLYELKPFINVDGYSGMYRGSKGSPRNVNTLDSHNDIKPVGEDRVR